MNQMNDKKSGFAEALRSCRHAAGLTQKEVAQASGLSTSYIALLEAGERNPPRRQIVERLARSCNVNETFLVRIAKHGGTGLAPIQLLNGEDCMGQEGPCDIDSVNGKMLDAVIDILEKNAPELSYEQIFQKIAGLPLWWRFFTVCHHENMTGKLLLTQREKLVVQEKLTDLERLDSFLLPSKFSATRESDFLSLTQSVLAEIENDDLGREMDELRSTVKDTVRSSKDMGEAGLAYIRSATELQKILSSKYADNSTCINCSEIQANQE